MAVSTPFHNGVSQRGFHFEDFSFTYNLTAGITHEHIGKAVALSTAAANTVKLAGDGDFIIGRLATVEDRTVAGILIGAVELRFANYLPIKSGLTGDEAVVVGSTVVGAGNGEVKALVDSVAAGGKVYIPFSINQTDLLAGTAFQIVSPVAGRVARVRTTVQAAVTTGGDITVEVNDAAVNGLTVTIANGATAGTPGVDTPTAAHASAVVAAGDKIEIVPSAAFDTAGALNGVLEIDLAATPNHYRNFVAEIVGTNAVVVQV